MSCRFCGGATKRLYDAVDENRRISTDRFTYVQCADCATIDLVNPPSDLGAYYHSDYYDIPTPSRLATLGARQPGKINVVSRFAKGGRLLEVGGAFGVFAAQAKAAGFDVDVVEMDERCCAFLRDVVGVRAIRSDTPHEAIPLLPPHEVIVIWHVIEHLPDPLAFMRAAAANLAPGGLLFIGTPNPDAFQFALMGKHWPHLDAPRHLTLLPAPMLTRAAAELGLERVHFTTDDLDARSWNAFGWQRLLMNRVRSRFLEKAMFVLGYGLSLLFIPFDRRADKGSAYTAVFRKTP